MVENSKSIINILKKLIPSTFSHVLHVSNGKVKFKMTYLRAQEELANNIPDLEFSAKRYFLFNFLSKNIHGENFYRDLIYFMCELRCGTVLFSFFIAQFPTRIARRRMFATLPAANSFSRIETGPNDSCIYNNAKLEFV